MIYNSKEMIVLQAMLILVVLMGWKYTKVFFNNLRGMNTGLMKINYSLLILMVMGGTGFRGVELMLVLIMVRRLIPVINS